MQHAGCVLHGCTQGNCLFGSVTVPAHAHTFCRISKHLATASELLHDYAAQHLEIPGKWPNFSFFSVWTEFLGGKKGLRLEKAGHLAALPQITELLCDKI